MKVKEDTQARNKIESILLEEIEKLQMALVHKSESSKCTHVFEQLYDYIRKAQKQVNFDTYAFTILLASCINAMHTPQLVGVKAVSRLQSVGVCATLH